MVQMMDMTIAGIGVFFSIVSAYIVAIYFFLHRAPALLKIVGFSFFSLICAILFEFVSGTFDHARALVLTLIELSKHSALSPVGLAAIARSQGAGSVNQVLQLAMLAGLALVYIALCYMTFFHRWHAQEKS